CHLDDALFAGLQDAGVDGGGGQARIVGVDAGAPDRAVGRTRHLKKERLADLAAKVLQRAGVGHRPRAAAALAAARTAAPLAPAVRLDLVAAIPLVVVVRRHAVARRALVGLLAGQDRHLDRAALAVLEDAGVDHHARQG